MMDGAMRGKYLRLGISLAVLLAGATTYVAAGLRMFDAFRTKYPIVQGQCGNDITWIAPKEIYSAFYASAPNPITVQYRSATPQVLHLTVSIPGFTDEQTADPLAGPTSQETEFKPPLRTLPDARDGPLFRDAEVRLRVQVGNALTCESSLPVAIYARQEMRWFSGDTDNAQYLAAWVTPQAAVIRDLVGKAAQWREQHADSYPDTHALYGYDQGRASAADVREQVDAIFDTLQQVAHLHYGPDNGTFTRDGTQLIHLPHDILADTEPTGMCVETSVIMASALEHLGMRPFIIIVPGHAFLGVALGDNRAAPIEYWETSDLNAGITGSQANAHGDAEYEQYLHPQIVGGAVQPSVVRVVDINLERTLGVEPMLAD